MPTKTPKIPHSDILYCKNHEMESYNEISKGFNSINGVQGEWGFKYFVFSGGYSSQTDQWMFAIKVPKNCSHLDLVKKEILEVMSNLKVIKSENNSNDCIIIPIYSETRTNFIYLVYEMYFKTYKICLENTIFSTNRLLLNDIKYYKSLDEAIKVISEYYYSGIEKCKENSIQFSCRVNLDDNDYKHKHYFVDNIKIKDKKTSTYSEGSLDDILGGYNGEEVEIIIKRKKNLDGKANDGGIL